VAETGKSTNAAESAELRVVGTKRDSSLNLGRPILNEMAWLQKLKCLLRAERNTAADADSRWRYWGFVDSCFCFDSVELGTFIRES